MLPPLNEDEVKEIGEIIHHLNYCLPTGFGDAMRIESITLAHGQGEEVLGYLVQEEGRFMFTQHKPKETQP